MSDHGDLLAKLMTHPDAAKATPPPAPYVPPPGWTPAPVQADAPQTYQPPPGWQVPGQAPPAPTAQQANAPQTYQAPPGWQVPGQAPSPIVQAIEAQRAQALNAATQQALQARFGGKT